VSNPQVKQRCYFNQFFAINDDTTSNLSSIYVKSKQWGILQEGEREREMREWIKRERSTVSGKVRWRGLSLTIGQINT